ncbi:MAG TPA: hypothetical protein PLW68_00505, partial [Casimicrobiaceae bacterium]|nr:hypothetical protein [Casimicrobiaceae bacterium]
MTTPATQVGSSGGRAIASSVGRPTNICRYVLPLAVVFVSLTGCEKFALDRQMEELCKKDGGVR